MNKFYKFLAMLTVVFLFNCEQDDSSSLSNYVGFEQGPLTYTVDNDATRTIDVTVAASNKSGSDRSYDVMVDEESSTLASTYSVPATVTIPANSNVGTLSVSVTDNEDLSFDAQSLVIDFVDEAGMDFGGPITLNIAETCVDTIVNLSISLDNYPEETAWELYDLSGAPTVINSADYGTYADAEHYSTVDVGFCLPSGDYGLVVYDGYGDGIINEAETAYLGFVVTSGGEELASAAVGNSGNAGTDPTIVSVQFTID